MFERFFEGPPPARLSMLAPPQLKSSKSLHQYAVYGVPEMHKLLLKAATDEFIAVKRPGQIERENKQLRDKNAEQKETINQLQEQNQSLTANYV